jgi:L-arabinonolactonase
MLYITSARDGLDAAALADQPSAGALFAAPAGTTGLPEPRFAGTPPPRVIATPPPARLAPSYSLSGKHTA